MQAKDELRSFDTVYQTESWQKMILIVVQLNERLLAKMSYVAKSQRTLTALKETKLESTQLRLRQHLDNCHAKSLKLKVNGFQNDSLWFLHDAVAAALKQAWINCLLETEHILSDVSKAVTTRYDHCTCLFLFESWGFMVQKNDSNRKSVMRELPPSYVQPSYVRYRIDYSICHEAASVTNFENLVPTDLQVGNICRCHTKDGVNLKMCILMAVTGRPVWVWSTSYNQVAEILP